MVKVQLRQEIGGFHARHLQQASCLHFLKPELDGLQVRHL